MLAGLLQLVTVDEHSQASRRRAELAALPADLRTEMTVFADHRLLTIQTAGGGGDSESGPPVIDIAHEQILTTWKPLADTIAAATDTLRLRSEPCVGAVRHRSRSPASGLVLASRKLAVRLRSAQGR